MHEPAQAVRGRTDPCGARDAARVLSCLLSSICVATPQVLTGVQRATLQLLQLLDSSRPAPEAAEVRHAARHTVQPGARATSTVPHSTGGVQHTPL